MGLLLGNGGFVGVVGGRAHRHDLRPLLRRRSTGRLPHPAQRHRVVEAVRGTILQDGLLAWYAVPVVVVAPAASFVQRFRTATDQRHQQASGSRRRSSATSISACSRGI